MEKKTKDSSVLSTLRGIKEKIFGKDVKTIDKIDNILGELPSKLLSKSSSNRSELLKDTISNQMVGMSDELFKNLTPASLANQENKERAFRYKNCDDVCDSIPYCARALGVLTDEIVSPDNITKQSIQILGLESYNSGNDSAENTKYENLQSIKKALELDDHITEVVKETLKYGDCFLEIIDIEDNSVPLNDVVFMENDLHTLTDTEKSENRPLTPLNIKTEYNVVNGDIIKKNTASFSIEFEAAVTKADKDKEDKNDNPFSKNRVTKKDKKSSETNLSRLKIMKHDPELVIKIQSTRNKLCLGYLVSPCSEESFADSGIQKITFADDDKVGVNDLYAGIINHMSRVLKVKTNTALSLSKVDLKNVLKRLIFEYEKSKDGKVKLRYVPTSKMEHFKLGDRYFPYGESIFQRTMFQAKMLIALQTANSIKRLTDATDKRAIYFEIGMGLNRNERNFIEQIKEQMRKKKYSLDTFGSISSIPSSVNSYEDWFIPTKNGTRMVELDTIPRQSDARSVADELKFFRDIVVASLDVPPSYIGLEENNSTKSTLSQESSLFARVIISYQKIFSKHLESIFRKVNNLISNEKMVECTITLPSPQALLLESTADRFETAGRIVDALSQIEVPKQYSIKQYYSLDWSEIDKAKTELTLDELKNPPSETVPGDENGDMGNF